MLEDHEIVAVNDVVVLLCAELAADAGRLQPFDLCENRAAEIGQALGDLLAMAVDADDRVACAELSVDAGDPGGEQAFPPPRERLHRAVVQRERALRPQRMGDPVLATGEPAVLREDARAASC